MKDFSNVTILQIYLHFSNYSALKVGLCPGFGPLRISADLKNFAELSRYLQVLKEGPNQKQNKNCGDVKRIEKCLEPVVNLIYDKLMEHFSAVICTDL